MKIEMHVHTSEGSLCGKVAAAEVVRQYAGAGFDAIVLTNHYGAMIVEGFENEFMGKWESFGNTPEERSERYMRAYILACDAAKKYGIKVFPGMELTLTEGVEDYLLYGIGEDFVLKYPEIYKLSLVKVAEICRDENVLLIQAHPCRDGYPGFSRECRLQSAKYLDGVELNQSPDHGNNNEKVLAWIKEHPYKLVTAGSDYHKPHFLGCGWIKTQYPVANMCELADCLRLRQYDCYSKKYGRLTNYLETNE